MTTNNEAFANWFDSYCREMNIDESEYSGNSFAIGKSNMKFGYNAAKAESEKEIAELQASNNRLRELLSEARGDVANQLSEYHNLLPYKQHRYDAQKATLDSIDEALSSTPAQSLAEFENEVIERCAKVCDDYYFADEAKDTILEMKGK